MKKSVRAHIAIIIIIFPLLFLLYGCSTVSEQPTKEEFEQYLCENSDDFDTILNYLIDQKSIVRFVYDGVDFENWFDTDVSEDVINAIKRLKYHDRIIVSKSENTIYIELWHPFMKEKSSGLAYSINGVDKPEVEYITEMTPISEPGWYYYET